MPDVTFNMERVGLQNMPECFDANTRELDYLNLFLDNEFWDLLCTNTNLYVAQVKALHLNHYYTNSYKSASVLEMKAFLVLRLMMEKIVVKPWYVYKDVLLPHLQHHYNLGQQLTLDKGMIPTKNRLAIKQYIKDKPVKWGIKFFMLWEGRIAYIASAKIYRGKDQAQHIKPLTPVAA